MSEHIWTKRFVWGTIYSGVGLMAIVGGNQLLNNGWDVDYAQKYISDQQKQIDPNGSNGVTLGTETPAATQAPAATTAAPNSKAHAAAANTAKKPIIVLDPGHAPAKRVIDPVLNIIVSENRNQPEMQQMYDLATKMIGPALTKQCYQVEYTKKSVNDSTANLKSRSDIANKLHADLMVPLHSDPGGSKVFYPKLGEFRYTANGRKAPAFSNNKLADTDMKYAKIMAAARSAAEGRTVQAGSYNDIYGMRIIKKTPPDMQKGNVLTAQYYAKVPSVYNEFSRANKAKNGPMTSQEMSQYAQGVIKGINNIIPTNKTGC